MNNPQEQALREAKSYILKIGFDSDIAPVIEQIDGALSASRQAPHIGEEWQGGTMPG